LTLSRSNCQTLRYLCRISCSNKLSSSTVYQYFQCDVCTPI